MKKLSGLVFCSMVVVFNLQTAFAANSNNKNCDNLNPADTQKCYSEMFAGVPAKTVFDCAVINGKENKKEYEKCIATLPKDASAKKPASKLATDKNVCGALKSTGDLYDSYVLGEQIGAVKEGNFVGTVYRSTTDAVNKFIDQECGKSDAYAMVNEAQFQCYSSCDSKSASVMNKADKKRIEAVAKDCRSICQMDHLAKTSLLDGVVMANSLKTSDCSNPTKDSISTLGRTAKELERKSASEADKAKSVIGK